MRSLIPTRRLVLALVPAALLSVGIAIVPAVRALVYSIDVVVFAVAVVDAIRCRALPITVSRELPRIWSSGRPERVLLRVVSPVAIEVQVHQSLPPELVAEGLPRTIPVPAGGEATIAWRGTLSRRGRFVLGAHHVRHTSPWGFWERQLDLEAADAVEVWPDVKALSEYDLLARRAREGMLLRSVRRPGNDVEFDRLRAWQNGDEARRVDWKATARARQPIVRQMREPTGQNVLFLLDCGRTMTAETDARPAFDHALDATLLLAHIALRRGDRVGLLGVGATLRARVPIGSGTGRALLRATCDLFPTLDEPDWTLAFSHLHTHVRRRALVVVFSNLVDGVTAELLGRLFRSTHRHLVLWVCLRDPGVEALTDSADPFERGAAAEVLHWRRGVLDQIAARGVTVLDVTPAELTPALVDRYLAIKSRGLL